MATLPTNFKDDILDTSVNTRRRYRVYENTDGTIELEDVTEYSQVGDVFGAGQINSTNTEVNKKFDKNMLVRDLETINAITKEGYAPDALALKEVNQSLGDISNIGNDTYNSFEKLLQYYIDNGYLPDVNKMALIPEMTSNTTPSGVVSASSIYGANYEAFRAFDKTNFKWNSNGNGTSEWIQYKFANPVNAKEITYSNVTDGINGAQNSGSFKLQVSSDGSNWVDVSGTITQSNGSVTFESTQIQYVRCLQVGGSNGLAVNEIQVYS